MKLTFKVFDYRPSVWLIVVNGLMTVLSALVSYFLTNIIFRSTNLISFLTLFLVITFIGTILLSRSRFKRVGTLSFNDSGLKFISRASIERTLSWDHIKSISLRKVDHSIVNLFGYFGGFCRYNHFGYRVDTSEKFYDKIEVNDQVYYIFIYNRADFTKLETLAKRISEHRTLETEEIKFKLSDLL